MANYSREDAEKQGNAEVGLGASLLTGLAALAIGGLINSAESNKKKERIQQINQQIQDIDREINDYRAIPLGGLLYAAEISDLEGKRRKLQAERNKLQGEI